MSMYPHDRIYVKFGNGGKLVSLPYKEVLSGEFVPESSAAETFAIRYRPQDADPAEKDQMLVVPKAELMMAVQLALDMGPVVDCIILPQNTAATPEVAAFRKKHENKA